MSDTTQVCSTVTDNHPTVVGTNHDEVVSTSGALFKKAAVAWLFPRIPTDMISDDNIIEDRRVLETSFQDISDDNKIAPHPGGLVETIIRAYQQDLHLILRPDDVWLAILTQFTFFVKGNQQSTPPLFKVHEEGKILEANVHPLSYGRHIKTLDIVWVFTAIVQDRVIDGALGEWILPYFSTTTVHDIIVACISLLATTNHCFEYECHGGCGFPSVTLMGDKKDWEDILERIDNIEKFGGECIQWAEALRAVLTRMINSFDSANIQAIKDLWTFAVHSAGVGGPGELTTISGWLVAFCFWNEQGGKIYNYTDDGSALTLNNVVFPTVDLMDLPPGIMEVQMLYKDYKYSLESLTCFIASHVGATVSTKAGDNNEATGKDNTYQPRSGWWLVQEDCRYV